MEKKEAEETPHFFLLSLIFLCLFTKCQFAEARITRHSDRSHTAVPSLSENADISGGIRSDPPGLSAVYTGVHPNVDPQTPCMNRMNIINRMEKDSFQGSLKLIPSLTVERNTVGIFNNGISVAASSSSKPAHSPDKALNRSNHCWFSRHGDSIGAWYEVKFYQTQKISGILIKWCHRRAYRILQGQIDIYDAKGKIVYSRRYHFSIDDISNIKIPEIANATRVRCTAIQTTDHPNIGIASFTVNSQPIPQAAPIIIGSHINTTINTDSTVTLLIKDRFDNVIRTVIDNTQRPLGKYSDYWDCRDDTGTVVTDGIYFAVMYYLADGQLQILDPSLSTGGHRYDVGNAPPLRPQILDSSENDFLPIHFFLDRALEVTLLIGVLNSEHPMIETIVNHKPLPSGNHVFLWDGAKQPNSDSRLRPEHQLFLKLWGYHLPTNAMIMTGGKPVISAVSVEPDKFSPFSETCDSAGYGEGILLNYTLSEDAALVEMRVYHKKSGVLLRTNRQINIPAGKNNFFWDAKNKAGEYVDIGDYQLGVIATDRHGNQSMLKYTRVRIEY